MIYTVDIISVLRSFVYNMFCYFRAEIVINCEGFWKLLQLQDNIRKHQFVPEVKVGLCKAFSLAADAFVGDDKQNEYWLRVSIQF